MTTHADPGYVISLAPSGLNAENSAGNLITRGVDFFVAFRALADCYSKPDSRAEWTLQEPIFKPLTRPRATGWVWCCQAYLAG